MGGRISAYPQAVSLIEMHAFSWSGTDLAHFVWVGMAAIMPFICLGTAVVVIRTRGMPRRWLWAPICFLAGPVFVLNWTTGAPGMNPFHVLFFGAGMTKSSIAAPWILSFGLPAGAITALTRRQRWLLTRHEQDTQEASRDRSRET